MAISYVLVDTYDKGHAAYLLAGDELADEGRLHPDLNLPRYSPHHCPASEITPLPCSASNPTPLPCTAQRAHAPTSAARAVFSALHACPAMHEESAVCPCRAVPQHWAWLLHSVRADLCCGCRLTQLLSLERTLDTVVWQMLASVILPGAAPGSALARVAPGLGLEGS